MNAKAEQHYKITPCLIFSAPPSPLGVQHQISVTRSLVSSYATKEEKDKRGESWRQRILILSMRDQKLDVTIINIEFIL